jgi:DUF4097 and DUF4098 domain-containing protein YvlB
MFNTSKFVSILAVVFASACTAMAERAVSESRPADNDVEVTIELLAGHVNVAVWDKAEVSVEGTIGDDVESVEIRGDGSRIEIVVEIPDKSDWGHKVNDADAQLEIRVPRGAEVEIESLSADVEITGISGDARAESVSGDITIETDSRSIEAGAVSGDVRIKANAANEIEVEAVSGDVEIEGISGSVSVEAVSGDIEIKGSLSRAEFEAVSGDITIWANLLPGARIEINSLSGRVDLALPANASARFRVETFSGSIKSDFGSAARSGEYSPGMDLDATIGDGDADVRIESFSGTVRIRAQ